MIQEREHAAGDLVHRRLVARDEQRRHHGDHLVLGEAVARLLRVDQRADQAYATSDRLSRDVGPKVPGRPRESPEPAYETGDRGPGAYDRRPLRELRPVFEREAEQFADDCERERAGEVRDEIDRGRPRRLARELVHRLVGQCLEVWPEGVDAPHPERPVDEATEPTVIRLVAQRDVGRQRTKRPRQEPEQDRYPTVARCRRALDEPMVIGEQLGYRVVRRRHPRRAYQGKPQADQRARVTHASESRRRVLLERR
jgi:hypothetical protein